MMRILGLHGMGTSSQVLEMQTAALRHELGNSIHVFEFVEGSVPWPAAAGIPELFPDAEDFFAFYDPTSAQSILTALDDLEDWITDNGPFDGCLGFSQGAALAAMLIIRQQNRQNPTFRFAIFICAAVPHDDAALQLGEKRLLHSAIDGQVIGIPTAHIVGIRDPNILSALELSQLCQKRGKAIFDHGGGHEIPRLPKEITLQMATVVNEVIIKAEFVQ